MAIRFGLRPAGNLLIASAIMSSVRMLLEPADSMLTINWTDTATVPAVTSYRVEYSADSSDWQLVGTFDTATTSTQLEQLMNGTEYYVRIAAINAMGQGDWLQASATPAGKASAPTFISLTAGDGSATLSWVAPVNTGGSVITGYMVEKRPSGQIG